MGYNGIKTKDRGSINTMTDKTDEQIDSVKHQLDRDFNILSVNVTDEVNLIVDKNEWDEVGKIKIDHYSWDKDSIYRHFNKKYINNKIIEQITVIAENEFLRWTDEYAKNSIMQLIKFIHFDSNIPEHPAWEDDTTFEKIALQLLIEILKSDKYLNLIEASNKTNLLKEEAERSGDAKKVQVYERIAYELKQCSLNEFTELKKAIFE